MRQAPWGLVASVLALPLACTTTDRTPTDQQNVYEALLAQARPALERFYKGDPSRYVELFADELTYFDPRSGGCLDGIIASKDYFRSQHVRITNHGLHCRTVLATRLLGSWLFAG